MAQPMFSVIVPTRERADTLLSCLRTCLDQDFDDYEILVADNASSPATREVVDGLASDRIRYLRSDTPLAMSANWERAVEEASGEYVTVLGDDNALMPYALRELATLIADHGRPRAVRFGRAQWTWPSMTVGGDQNCLVIPLSRQVEWREAKEVIADVIAFRAGPEQLPMVYTGVIHHDVLDEHRRRVGTVFPALYPDGYSGIAHGWLAGRYLSVDVPMAIDGFSRHSNMVAQLFDQDGHQPAADFSALSSEGGFVAHPRVPDIVIPPVPVMDSFERARDHLFPDDVELVYDRWDMTVRYLRHVPELSETDRERHVRAIADALADRPELAARVVEEARRHEPAVRPRLRPERLGFDGDRIAIDTSSFGIEDVHQCTRLATHLLGFDSGPIDYGLPDAAWLHAHIAQVNDRAFTAEARVEEREAEVARLRQWIDRLRAKVDKLGRQRDRLRKELAAARAEASANASLRRVPRQVAAGVRAAFTPKRREGR